MGRHMRETAQTRALAESITNALFTDATGERANRLVSDMAPYSTNHKPKYGGGWCFEAATAQVLRVLLSHPNHE